MSKDKSKKNNKNSFDSKYMTGNKIGNDTKNIDDKDFKEGTNKWD